MEYHFKGNGLDKKMIDRNLKEMETYYLDKYQLDIFTKKGMKDYIFKHSNERKMLHDHCNLIAGDFKESSDDNKYDKYDKQKYQKLVKEKKYQWLFEELLDLINPPFSRSEYQVKLT